ncbi:MAG TPA: IS701 family transposase [Pilimelia sp.]|nr:IS701 family transposase [Pilimelia sp.]
MAGRALGELDAVLAPWFARAGTRLAAQQYVRGLASMVERKNSWQLAEHAGHHTPDRFQRLLGSAAWDEHGVREDVRDWAVRQLADAEAVLVADDTGFLKKGRKSAGVQRQYSGTAGRVENCQIGVFLAYACPRGRLLIDAELYLPVSWTDDPRRCVAAGVPVEVGFATKPELARIMIERVVKAGLPFGWVAADEAYGDNPGLRGWLESERIRYVMAVSCDHLVATAGGPVRADVAAARPGLAWQRLSCGDGAKGPRLYDFAEVPDAGSGVHRLVIRRAIDDGELAVFWCYTPAGARLADLVRVIGARWAVEECFQASKGQVGLDHYQVRSYPGWYRHITLAIATHSWLSVTAVLVAGQRGNRHPTVPPRHQTTW